MRIVAYVRGALLGALLLVMLFCGAANGEARQPRMGIFTQEGARIDLSLKFVDSGGKRASLRSMVNPGPALYPCADIL